MMGYVEITKCSHGGWYKDLVGQLFPVYRDMGNEWLTYELTGHTNFILKTDAKSVHKELNDEFDAKITKEQ